jgi:hypothetical protein
MAESIELFFDRAIVVRIANSIVAVPSSFNQRAFVAEASDGLEELELKGRAQHIADALAAHLPADVADAARARGVPRLQAPRRRARGRGNGTVLLSTPHHVRRSTRARALRANTVSPVKTATNARCGAGRRADRGAAAKS